MPGIDLRGAFAAAAVLCALAICAGGPVASAEQASLLPAADVPQPDDWDAGLRLAEPVDLNPAADVIEIELEARIAEVEIAPGRTVSAWTYNGSLPGPFIRAKVGDTLVVHLRNSLPEPTTMHWHGVRVPNAMDGAPGFTQALIEPGGTFRYEFVLRDAGTFWYHPHHSSSSQVGWGLYGPIVVSDPAEARGFGDELMLVLSDISVDADGTVAAGDSGGSFGDLFGREGNVMLVNGRVRPTLRVRAGKPQRWRLVNAARARYFSFRLGRDTFVRIGGDGGLIARAEPLPVVDLVPGERMDVVFTPPFAAGSTVPLRWRPVDRGYGTVFGRSAEPIMDITTIEAPAVEATPVAGPLREIPAVDVAAAVHHTLDLTIDSDGDTVEMGINGVPSWDAEPLHARLGETHVWTVTNDSTFDHPFHLHGYFFQVLDDDRVPEWKDTVNVPVDSSVRLAIRFDERPGMWMYHCHILDHADVGMMGHLHVE